MKVTGYQLREAITMWKLRKTTAEGQFSDSLAKFEEEVKDSPVEVVRQVLEAESAIVALQVAQMRYNLAVKVTLNDPAGEVTLAEAIKLSGVVSRAEKIWAGAATASRDPYRNHRVRDPNQILAYTTITPKQVLEETSRLTKRAGALRAAIGAGNTREVEIEDLAASLFE